MTEALAILNNHIAKAKADLEFHQARGPRLGNVEASIAAHKIGWLKAIARELVSSGKPRNAP